MVLFRKFPICVIGCCCFIAGCVSIPEETPSIVFPPKEGIYHKVRTNETIWRISKMYNVTIEDIIRSNNIPNVAHIEKNQLLFIPGTSSQQGVREQTPEKTEVFSVGFEWPLKGNIISYFGERRGLGVNQGVDIEAAAGDDVHAAQEGRVVVSDYVAGMGHTVILEHQENLYTVYTNNAVLLVKTGNAVKKGTPIAKVGKNGKLAFLHFEVRKNAVADNPLYYLP